MKIEQMLHGYDDGHRLLAASILLKNKADMEAIAMLSDWSEYVATGGGDSSYVTAYPLSESEYYVIAKTWYADEKKRPGCVWTHSLLIPFSGINSIDNFHRIEELFVRPEEEKGFDEYSHTIEYENRNYNPGDYIPLTVDRGMAAQILLTLLNGQHASLYLASSKENQHIEELILSEMNELPLGILQHVSWCTGSAYLRKLNGQPLTLQVLTHGVENRGAYDSVKEEPWIRYVLNAIVRGDVSQGQLIRMFADDIGDNEEHYAAIVKVLSTLEGNKKDDAEKEQQYTEVFNIIVHAFPTIEEGKIIKKLVANKNFSARYCDDETFFYLFGTVPVDGVFALEETCVEKRWNDFAVNEHQQYMKLLCRLCKSGHANKWGIEVLRESGDRVTSEEVAEMIRHEFQQFNTIALLNPAVLDKIPWQAQDNDEIASTLPILLDSRTQQGFTQWRRLFEILLEKKVEISAPLVSTIFAKSTEATGILLGYMNRDNNRYANYLMVQELKQHTSEVLNWLSDEHVITQNVAYAIVNTVDEHSHLVSSKGARLWRPFLGLQYHGLKQEVYAFLFSLSFNWPSDGDALQLMQMAFFPLHVLEASGKLSYGNWARISPYMESVLLWDEWDKCKKMRKTVVKRLQRAGLKKEILDNFTPDGDLNEKLKKLW